MSLFRTKAIETDLEKNTGLKRSLNAFDLVMLGIGAIIGTGIFVLTGKAAAVNAGPAVVLSFIVAGASDDTSVGVRDRILGAVTGSMDVAMNANAVEVERRLGRAIMSSSHGFWSLGGFVGGSAGSYVIAHSDAGTQALLAAAVRRPFTIIASWHVFMTSWLQRFMLPRLGGFSVYREGMDRESLKCATHIVAEGKFPLVIFAEGIVTRCNDRLVNFMEGPAFMARAAAMDGTVREVARGEGLVPVERAVDLADGIGHRVLLVEVHFDDVRFGAAGAEQRQHQAAAVGGHRRGHHPARCGGVVEAEVLGQAGA